MRSWRRSQSDKTPDPYWMTENVECMFADPRFKYLKDLTDTQDVDRDDHSDPRMFLDVAIAVYNMQSAEMQSRALARATWALVIATVGLVIATIVLVIVTVG
jgi:hypothetical protein